MHFPRLRHQRFWFSKTRVALKHLHFSQAPWMVHCILISTMFRCSLRSLPNSNLSQFMKFQSSRASSRSNGIISKLIAQYRGGSVSDNNNIKQLTVFEHFLNLAQPHFKALISIISLILKQYQEESNIIVSISRVQKLKPKEGKSFTQDWTEPGEWADSCKAGNDILGGESRIIKAQIYKS